MSEIREGEKGMLIYRDVEREREKERDISRLGFAAFASILRFHCQLLHYTIVGASHALNLLSLASSFSQFFSAIELVQFGFNC